MLAGPVFLALALLCGSASAQYPSTPPSYATTGPWAYMSMPTGCSAAGTTISCTGVQLDDYDAVRLVEAVLHGAKDGAVVLSLKDCNLTGAQVTFAAAEAYKLPDGSPSISLKLENTVIAKNQLTVFGAFAAQTALALSADVVSSKILDNQLILAAALSVGGSASASLNVLNSDILHNQVAAAGALGISSAASARVAGSGGSAIGNSVVAAGLIASGGVASASASATTIPGDNNSAKGIGIAFTEQPLVAEIVNTVYNAVFVSSGGLSAGLQNVQNSLCTQMEPGQALYEFADNNGLDVVINVAKGILCGATSIKLADIPGMVDGSSSSSFSLNSIRSLATGDAHVGVKSAWGLLKLAASHPQAAAALLSQLKIIQNGN